MIQKEDKLFLLEIFKDVMAAKEAARWLDAAEEEAKEKDANKRTIQFELPSDATELRQWADVESDEIIAGQRIRMFEPDGTPVDFGGGQTEAIVEYGPRDARGGGFILILSQP